MTAIDLLDRALKITRRRQMTRCQVLILTTLVKKGSAMQLHEISTEVNEHRQTVQKTLAVMEGKEVRVVRPSKVKTLVYLTQAGVDALLEITNTKVKQ